MALLFAGKNKYMTEKTKALVMKGFSQEQIALVKRTVAKGATDDELKMFMHVAKKNGLDPFNKEIWFYKVKDQTLMFASRDGFMKIAQSSKEFNGLKSAVIRKSDIAEIDIQNNAVKHVFKPTTDRGAIVGAWATAYRKNAEPCTVYVDYATFNKGMNAWKSHPEEMIKKVAEAHALKKLFGITGFSALEEKDSIIAESKAERITVQVEEVVASETPVNPMTDKLILALEATDEADALKKINERLGLNLSTMPGTVIELKQLYGQLLTHNNQSNGK